MFVGFSNLVVFLVEPSGMQARAITRLLNQLEVRNIQHFTSAGEMFDRLARETPSVVISALYLPDMSGSDLVLRLRMDETFQDIPFILISSETRPEVLDMIRQAGVCGILPKPFSLPQLNTALRTTMDYLDGDVSQEADDIDFKNVRVLLVDDSFSSRRFIRRVLENLGIDTFIEAENGAQAMIALADTLVDLVVTDYNMPEMDGKQLLDYIRNESWQQTVPVLMVTSTTDQERLAAVEDAGVSGICDKPFEPQMVRALIQKILRNNQTSGG